MGFFPYMGEILWVFLTFMEVFPIPPLSRGRSGGGWGIYVAVVLESVHKPTVSKKVVIPAPFCNGVNSSRNPGFPVKTGTQSLRWFPTFVGTTSGCPRIKYGAGSSSPA